MRRRVMAAAMVVLGALSGAWAETGTVGPQGLVAKAYSGEALSRLNPITNLLALTPTGVSTQLNDLTYSDGQFAGAITGVPAGEVSFSLSWEGWFHADEAGLYTFGTSSDDGSVLCLDVNDNGSFADAGDYVVANIAYQGETPRLGSVTLDAGYHRIAIGYCQGSGGRAMRAKWQRGSQSAFGSLSNYVNGTGGHFFTTFSPRPVIGIGNAGGATGVTADQATLNGLLTATGTAGTAVFAFWGEVDGGTNRDAWANVMAWPAPQDTGAYAQVVAVTADRSYAYRFAATNADEQAWAPAAATFMTAPVTIAKDADASEAGLTPGTFTVHRASSATGSAVTVNYAVTGGTAGNGLDYAALPGTVTIPAGSEAAAIVIVPRFDRFTDESVESVDITILPGPYLIGGAAGATMDLVDNTNVTGALSLVWDNQGGNGRWDRSSLNWHRAGDPYGTTYFQDGDRVSFGVGDRPGSTVSLNGTTVTVQSLSFNWAQNDVGFTIAGGTILLGAGGILHNASWLSETISAAVVLLTNSLIQHSSSDNRQLYINGPIDTAGFRLTCDHIGQGFYIGGPIRGSGSVALQSGVIYYRGSNSFSGALRVSGANGGKALLDQNGVVSTSTNIVLYGGGTLEAGEAGNNKPDDGAATFGRLANGARVSLQGQAARLKIVGANNLATREAIGDLALDGDVGVVEVARNGATGSVTLAAARLVRNPLTRPVALVYGANYLLGTSEKVVLDDGGTSLTQIGGDGSRLTNKRIVPYLFTRTENTFAINYSRLGGASGLLTYDGTNGLVPLHQSNDYVNATAVAFPAVSADGDDNVRLPFTVVQPTNAASAVTLDGETTVNSLLFYNDKSVAHDKEFRLNGERLTVKSGLIMGGISASGTRMQPLVLNVATTDFASAEGVFVAMGPHYGSYVLSGALKGTNGLTLYIDSATGEGLVSLSGDNGGLSGPISVLNNIAFVQNLNALGSGGNALLLGNGSVACDQGLSGGRSVTVRSVSGSGSVIRRYGNPSFNIGGDGLGGAANTLLLTNNGAISPGFEDRAGTVTLQDFTAVRLHGGTLELDLFATNSCDRLSLSGSPALAIAGAALLPRLACSPRPGDRFLVVSVAGTNRVSGQFARGARAEAVVGARTSEFAVQYNSNLAGGDGNDVVLEYLGDRSTWGSVLMLH